MFCPRCGMLKSNCICDIKLKRKKRENNEVKVNSTSKTQRVKPEKPRNFVKNESQSNIDYNNITQKTIKQNFPFSTFLENQLDILTEIVDSIDNGYKYIILESGVGKSAIAVTLANIYKSSFILSADEKFQKKYFTEYNLINNNKFHVSNHISAFDEFKNLNKRKLLIIDDAHRIDENIVNLFSYTINFFDFDKDLIDNFYCDVKELEKKDYNVWLDFINHLSLNNERINQVINSIKEDPENWICFYDTFCNEKIVFKPLNVGNILKKYLLKNAEVCIFMSSTILNQEMFCKEIGIDISNVKFIHKDFHFDSDANQIFLRNSVNMRYWEDNNELLIPIIEDILEKHENEKGIIHADKIKYNRFIMEEIPNSRLISHTNFDFDRRLKQFKNSSKFVMVSESMGEDVGFPNDTCRFQIILKEHLIPYDKLAKYKDNESNWYSYKKAIYLVQMLQRATRLSDDYCINYILDENITKTISKDIIKFNFIPKYILDSIADMDVENCGLISENIKKQFGVYYLYDYYTKNNDELESLNRKIWNYKDYKEYEIFYEEEFNYFTEKLMEGISELSNQVIPNKIKKIALVSVPSSTIERDEFATIRESINCIENWYACGKTESKFGCKKEIINCSNLLVRSSDLYPSHLSDNRPSYGQHMNSIKCKYNEILKMNDVAFIILDDISTRGTIMNACEDILIENGVNQKNIYKFAIFKTIYGDKND